MQSEVNSERDQGSEEKQKDVLAFMNKLLKGWGGNQDRGLAADGTVVTFAGVHMHDSC